MSQKFLLKIFSCLLLSLMVVNTALAFDPFEASQWYLTQVKAPEAWAITDGSPDIVVAVIDTGVDLQQPDLQGNLWTNNSEIAGDNLDNDLNGYVDDLNGWNFVANTALPEPDLVGGYSREAVNHGTFLAGIIAAIHDNNLGIKGIAGQVKIMPLVALDSFGSGFSDAVAEAINYAVKNGASIINLSFGGEENSSELKEAILNAYNHNVVVVAAAGNNDAGGLNLGNKKVYPICYDTELNKNTVIGVVSVNKNNQLSKFSNYGGNCIDISAPGEQIVSLGYENSRYSYNGTSFATAIVTGAVALMKSLNSSLNTEKIAEILKSTAVDISTVNPNLNGQLGAGLINIFSAVEQTYKLYGAESGSNLYISQDQTAPGKVTILGNKGNKIKDLEVFSGKTLGLNLSSADVNADGLREIIAGAPAGTEPLVRSVDFAGHLIASFSAFNDTFRGGVRVVAGDLLANGTINYIVVPQSNYQPVVRIFDSAGKLSKEFLAFDKKNKAGLSVAVGDIVGDTNLEIIVGAPAGLAPEVKIFSAQGKLLKKFLAFPASFKGGVNVITLDNKIVVAPASNGGPTVRTFDSTGKVLETWLAYDKNMKAGVRLAVGDWNQDQQLEILTVPARGGSSQVRIWDQLGNLDSEFWAYDQSITSGFQIAVK